VGLLIADYFVELMIKPQFKYKGQGMQLSMWASFIVAALLDYSAANTLTTYTWVVAVMIIGGTLSIPSDNNRFKK
jgi:hypothetical protein